MSEDEHQTCASVMTRTGVTPTTLKIKGFATRGTGMLVAKLRFMSAVIDAREIVADTLMSSCGTPRSGPCADHSSVSSSKSCDKRCSRGFAVLLRIHQRQLRRNRLRDGRDG